MNNLLKYLNIAKLISDHISEPSDPIDENLKEWIDSSAQHKETFETLSPGPKLDQLLNEYEEIDLKKGWKQVYTKIPGQKRSFFSSNFLRVAAMITAPLLIGAAGLYLYNHANTEKEKSAVVAVKQDFKPGYSKAVLILANGSQVDLTHPDSKQLSDADGTIIKNQNNGLNYSSTKNKSDAAPVFNTLIVPVGGEYKITLSDGTKIWLNAASKLKYPTRFTNNTREVFLEGEAYFEVAHNIKKPFEVHTSTIVTKVFGTEFNIMAYNDEPYIQTTLIKGSVEVQNNSTASGKKSIMLKPGVQANLNKANNYLDSRTVNTYIYTAWKDGVFIFNNESMESIMRKLSRWYNVKINFDNERTKEILFFGKVKRYENINTILTMIKKTEEVTYSTENNQIIIRRK